MSETVLNFYSHHQDRDGWEWSNFADFPIYFAKKVWRNSEAPFQAEKFRGTDGKHMVSIHQAMTPQEAADLGRDRSHPLRQDWDKPVPFALPEPLASIWQQFVGEPMLTKDYAMLKVVHCKLRQHPVLRIKLLATGTAMMVEHTTKDRYWADNGDGTGKNMLGKILMVLRELERRKIRSLGFRKRQRS